MAIGFPDYIVNEMVTQSLSNVTLSSVLMNQYTREAGHPRLVTILSKIYTNLTERSINPNSEILITVGGHDAIFCSIFAHVNPGDEVIIIEPFFESYSPATILSGGTPVFVPLRPKKAEGLIRGQDWVINKHELRRKFSHKTKMVILSSPNNPTGKIMNKFELQTIAKLCIKFNTLVLMDEVYEWMIFDNNKLIRMRMWNRTIRIGSAGKSFAVTGLKIGFAYGPEHLIKPLKLLHEYSTSR
ncbi:Kynurenine--oxoglutarate transaminase 3-like protein, partial [Leptotrombidium deliense]